MFIAALVTVLGLCLHICGQGGQVSRRSSSLAETIESGNGKSTSAAGCISVVEMVTVSVLVEHRASLAVTPSVKMLKFLLRSDLKSSRK